MSDRILIKFSAAADDDQPGVPVRFPVFVKSVYQPYMAFFRRKTPDTDKFRVAAVKNGEEFLKRMIR